MPRVFARTLPLVCLSLLWPATNRAEIFFADDFEADPADWVCMSADETRYDLSRWSAGWTSCARDDAFGALWQMGPGHNSNNAMYAWRYDGYLDYHSSSLKWLSGSQIKQEIYHRWYMKVPPAGSFDISTAACGAVKLWRYNLREYGYQPYNPELYLDFRNWSMLSENSLTLSTSTGENPHTWQLQPVATFNDDAWHSHELRIKLNTPGASDGMLQYWLDGTLLASYPDINFGFDSHQPLGLNNVAVGLGNACWQAEDRWTQASWSAIAFDDVAVSTAYVGPILAEERSPAPPTGLRLLP